MTRLLFIATSRPLVFFIYELYPISLSMEINRLCIFRSVKMALPIYGEMYTYTTSHWILQFLLIILLMAATMLASRCVFYKFQVLVMIIFVLSLFGFHMLDFLFPYGTKRKPRRLYAHSHRRDTQVFNYIAYFALVSDPN